MKSIVAFAFVLIAGVAANGYGNENMMFGGNNGCMDGMCGGYSDKHYGYAPYQFGYNFHDDHYGSQQSREEVADGHGGVKGSYSFVDGHGIKRIVEYVADKNGFRASIKTNEPGTAAQNPADVYMNANPVQAHYEPSSYKAASAPPKVYKAPAAGYAAPAKAEYPSSIYSMPAYSEY